MAIAKFVGALKKSGGIPREEKWESAKVKSHEENLERVLPDIVKKELERILIMLEDKDFIMVGGTAVVAYVPYRITTDIDIITYRKSGVTETLSRNYPTYRKSEVAGELSLHFMVGKYVDRLHIYEIDKQTYDEVWNAGSKIVGWKQFRFLIPHIDKLSKMKEESDRAVDSEDVQALRHWRKHWLGGKARKRR